MPVKNFPGKFPSYLSCKKTELLSVKKDEEDYIDRFFSLIKRENRFYLAPNLELLFRSIIEKLPLWGKFMMNIFQFGIISNQAYLTLPHYKNEGWDEKTFLDSITMSCFPLHPVTTALLCRLDFAGGNSIGGFVNEKLKARMDEPAIVNLDCGIYGGQITDFPNWIYPYEIADYFEENLRKVGEDIHKKLLHALDLLGNDISKDATSLLKALFLYHLGGLEKGEDHSKVLSLLSGLEYSTCRYYLKELTDKHKVIYFAETKKEYDFYVPGKGILDVYDKLDDEVSTQPLNFVKLAYYLMKYEFKRFEYFAKELGLEAGDFLSKRKVCRDEYCMSTIFLSSEGITDDIEYEYEKLDKNKARGLICYSITEFEEEILEDRRNAQELLTRFRSSYENFPVPLIFAFPRKPVEGIFNILLRLSVLNSWSGQMIKSYGQGYQKAKKELIDDLKGKIQIYFNQLTFITHQDVIKDLSEEEISSQKVIINNLFEASFPFRPPLNCSKLKDTARAGKYIGLCSSLLSRGGECDDENYPKKLHKNTKALLEKVTQEVLLAGKDKWGIIDKTRKVTVPQNKFVKKGWDLLDKEVDNDGPMDLFEVYKILQEPPFGYDDLSFCLLISAWMGFHRHLLEIYSGKNKIEIENFSEYFHDLIIISKISKEKILIRKLDEFLIEILNIKKSLMQEVCEYKPLKSLLTRVDKIIADKRCPENERKELKLMILSKKEDLEKYDKFFKDLAFIDGQLNEETSLMKLCEIRKKVRELEMPEKIEFSKSKYDALLKECDEKIEMDVKKAPRLNKIEDYSYIRNYLEEVKYFLLSAKLNNLTKEVDAHFLTLDEHYKKLQAEDQQKRMLKTVKKMPSPLDLSFRELLKNFDIVSNFIEKIDIKKLKCEAEEKQKTYMDQIEFLRKQVSEVEDKVYKVGTISECDFLKIKIESLKKRYEGTEYERRFPGLLKMLTEKRENLCDEGKIAREKKAIIQEFLYLKSLAEECRDTIMLYNLYGQIYNVEISSKELDKYEIQQIEEAKDFVLNRFFEFIEKELSDLEINKKSRYKKKKNRILEFQEKIRPSGKIDGKFINNIRTAGNKLEENYTAWKNEQKLIKKKNALMDKFYDLKKGADKTKDTLSLYEIYCKVNKVKIPEGFLDSENLKEIEEVKEFIFKKFMGFIKLELAAIEVSKKSTYRKKKSLFKDFKKKIKPVGKIDKSFIDNIRIAQKKLKEEYLSWKKKEEKEKIKIKLKKQIEDMASLPTGRISLCNKALEELNELKNFASEFDLNRLFEKDISREISRIEAVKEDFINRLSIYKSIIEQTGEPGELIKIKEELLRIQYIFDDPGGEENFHKVVKIIEKKLDYNPCKTKQIRKLFYGITDKEERMDCFVKLLQNLSQEEKKKLISKVKNI